jgi:ABC-type sugar transport system permease subunit
LKGIGLAPLNFLKDSNLALWTIATVEIWQRIGFVILVSYAGLVSMPGALIEAARIDGATGLQVLLRITLPLMRRVLVFVSVVTLIGALQSFDLIYVMTTSGGTGSSPGGPGISTYTLGLLVYNEGLIRGTYGTASATASILFVIVFFATLLQLRFFRQNWDY